MSNTLLLMLVVGGVLAPFAVQLLKRASRLVNVAALLLTVVVSVAVALVALIVAGRATILGAFLATCVVFALATVTFRVMKEGVGFFRDPARG